MCDADERPEKRFNFTGLILLSRNTLHRSGFMKFIIILLNKVYLNQFCEFSAVQYGMALHTYGCNVYGSCMKTVHEHHTLCQLPPKKQTTIETLLNTNCALKMSSC